MHFEEPGKEIGFISRTTLFSFSPQGDRDLAATGGDSPRGRFFHSQTTRRSLFAEVNMDKLYLGVEVRDFDLERIGFSLSVLDKGNKRQISEAYFRMTLNELNVFLRALKQAADNIEVSTIDSQNPGRLPRAAMLGERA
jgi:hypothetical protein